MNHMELYTETKQVGVLTVIDVRSREHGHRRWRYRCKSPEEAQALMRGVMLGQGAS